jgi:Ssp1 endopeptidase immunity protein Rap1a
MHRASFRLSFAIVAVFLLASALVLPARAQGLSTERLVEFCRDPASAVWRDIGQWLCPAYIRGLIDGARLQAIHTAGGVEGHRRIMQFCVPENADARAAIDAVLTHVRHMPESRREPAAATVYVALAAAWPCRP